MGSEPLSVVGYVRVSTDEQSRDGVSLEAQAERVRAYCGLYRLHLVCVISDAGESAKKLDRPGLDRALAMLAAGEVAGLVVAKLDRLTRSVKDLGTLVEAHFDGKKASQLFSVTEQIDTRSSGGRLVLNVLMSVAQWEREAIVERTQQALDHKRARGERIGTVPYGWGLGVDGKTLFRDPEEQTWIAMMRNWRILGNSYRAIAAELEARGVPTRSGRPWCHTSVSTILGRER